MARRVVSVLVLALLTACGGASTRPPEAFRPAACWFPPLQGIEVECGRLTVPENRAEPAVVVLRYVPRSTPERRQRRRQSASASLARHVSDGFDQPMPRGSKTTRLRLRTNGVT